MRQHLPEEPTQKVVPRVGCTTAIRLDPGAQNLVASERIPAYPLTHRGIQLARGFELARTRIVQVPRYQLGPQPVDGLERPLQRPGQIEE